MAGHVAGIMEGAKAISKRLIAAYVLDWIVLAILGLISFGFSKITPNYHAFSLVDLSISYPNVPQTVTIVELVAGTVLAPVALMVIIVFFFVPGPTTWRRMSKGEILRIKLWELNVAWLGMALAQATQFLVVQGLKNIIGKPRPHMLDVCQPDLSSLSPYTVGGFGQDIAPRWVLVDYHICRQSNQNALNDAFESFPSGHSSTAWAGMLYLALWLGSKFGVGFPVIPFSRSGFASLTAGSKKETDITDKVTQLHRDYRTVSYRDEAAAPPTWTLFLIYVPLGVAFYISATRYFDYYHHGFDVIAGSLFGIIAAWIGYRWYHGPLSRNAGWAWSPRSRNRAFGIGVGTLGYVTEATPGFQPSAESKPLHDRSEDLEMGNLGTA